MKAPSLDFELGMEVYATKAKGIGGRVRCLLEDFIVEEVGMDGGPSPCLLQCSGEGSARGVVSGPYTVFTLEKRGLDTFLALRNVAKVLGVGLNRFSVAGVKDARAVTVQRVSVFKVRPEALKLVKVEGVRVGDFSLSLKPVKTCDVYGNRFKVTVRDLGLGSGEVLELIREVWGEVEALGGFPSFFGYQRFGTLRPNTHKVGRGLVKARFKEAVMEFLAEPYPFESPWAYEARRRLKEGLSFEEALKQFPKGLVYERLVLSHLKKHPNDYVGAMRRLPRRLLSLFIHAYQAYIFNKVLSARLQAGLPLKKAFDGDSISLVDDKGFPTQRLIKVSSSNIHEANDLINKGRAVLALNLIGFKTKLASGLQGEIESKVLEEEDVTPTSFTLTSMPELSSPGAIRPALFKPEGFKVIEVSGDELNLGKLKLALSFTLKRGFYATIVLRELMKPQNPITAGF